MKSTDSPSDTMLILEEQMHALVDGRLPAEAAAELEARIALDATASATLAAWRSQRAALRRLHAELLDESIPPALERAVNDTAAAHQQRDQWWRWGGMAASVALAFVLGWGSNGLLQGNASAKQAAAMPVRSFAQQAAVAHAIYQPEVRHPVEVAAAQQDHLVKWLSNRLGRPLKVPVLSAQGYELVGGRLLPGDDGARAQFMFQNVGGERITLYVGAVKPGAGSDAAAAKETAFRFTDDGPVPGFYWVDQGFGYAIAGKLPKAALLVLATAVYQQL